MSLLRQDTGVAVVCVPSQAKEGTTYFYRIASPIYHLATGAVTLALTYVLPEGHESEYRAALVGARMRHLGFRPGVVYMDKEFCEGSILRYLTRPKRPSSHLSPAPFGENWAEPVPYAQVAKPTAPSTHLPMAHPSV